MKSISKARTESLFSRLSTYCIAPRHRVFVLTAFVALILSSCGPQTPAAAATQLIPTESSTPEGDSWPIKAGKSYSDAERDMQVSFLDVVGFQATVDEGSKNVGVVFRMRDIPLTVTKHQILDFAEYMLDVSIFLEPPASSSVNPDFEFLLVALSSSDNEPVGEGVFTPVPGTPATVPIDQLWDDKNLINTSGESVSALKVAVDPDADTFTLMGQLPGITSDAVFSFSTFYFDGSIDRPDNYVAPAAQETSTPGFVAHAYPGPKHYEGDVLSFEIQGDFDGTSDSMRMSLDGQAATIIQGQWVAHDKLLLPLAFDTGGQIGSHQLTFSMRDVEAVYSFDVLPNDQRPANEANAAWMVKEIGCCVLNYISGTAAARDIDFISEHFQSAAQQLSAQYDATFEPKLNVYIIDRMVGNGGFGGSGQLIISYTDRFYGPEVGAEGLDTLARHELSHAAGVGMKDAGEGIDFNYEGWAVYVAGGHYKPEPLAQRAAALYDLGYYVPVGQYIGQHELDYLYSAGVLTYIADTYGTNKLLDFISADENPGDGQPTPLDTAIQAMFGISQDQFDQNFQAWLKSLDPGDQLDDLRLTVELQDLRRSYQDTYATPPAFLAANFAAVVTRPEYLPVLIREADAPFNVAVELIIAAGQKAIVEGDYQTAENYVEILNQVLSSGTFEDPMAKDLFAIATTLSDAGYEVASLNIEGNQATAWATTDPLNPIAVELEKVGSIWQLKP